MTKRVLCVLLSLVLMFSVFAEETPQAETPVVEEVEVIESSEKVEEEAESSGAAPEVKEQIPAEVPTKEQEPVEEDPPQAAEESVSEPTECKTEEPVNEQEAEEPEELEPIPQEEPSKDVENSNVDDSGTGSTEHDEVLPEQSEAETEASTESGEDGVVDENPASEEHSVEATSEVITIPGENNEKETGTEDVGADESRESESEPEKEVSSETEEEQPEVSEEEQPEDEDLEDEETLETEEGDDKSDLEKGVEQDADEVSEGDSVLTEEPAEEAIMFAAPKIATVERITVNAENEPENNIIWKSDATSSNKIKFSITSTDKLYQYAYKVGTNGTWIGLKSGTTGKWATDYTTWTENGYFYISYEDLYNSMTNDTDTTIYVMVHVNKNLSIITETETFTYYKAIIDEPTITISTSETSVYPGDPIIVTATYGFTSGGKPISGTKYSAKVTWFVNGKDVTDDTNFTKGAKTLSWTAGNEEKYTVYAVLTVSY